MNHSTTRHSVRSKINLSMALMHSYCFSKFNVHIHTLSHTKNNIFYQNSKKELIKLQHTLTTKILLLFVQIYCNKYINSVIKNNLLITKKIKSSAAFKESLNPKFKLQKIYGIVNDLQNEKRSIHATWNRKQSACTSWATPSMVN